MSAFSLHVRRQYKRKTKEKVAHTLTQRQGHKRDAARRPAHRCTQSGLGDQLRRAQAEQSASSFFFFFLVTPVSKSIHEPPRKLKTHLCMSARADLRRCLHHLHLALTLHAPQRTDERRERFSFRHGHGRSKDVHIRSSSLCVALIVD